MSKKGMEASRRRRLRRLQLCLGLTAAATLMPVAVGHQDVAAMLARQPGVAERSRNHLIASPFGTIHAATFSFPRPTGSSIPRAPELQPETQLAHFDPRQQAEIGEPISTPLGRPSFAAPRIVFPDVNRALKADRLAAPFDAEQAAADSEFTGEMAMVSALSDPAFEEAPSLVTRPMQSDEVTGALPPQLAVGADSVREGEDNPLAETPDFEANAMLAAAQVYFHADRIAPLAGLLEPWKSGEEPVMVLTSLAPATLDMPASRPAPAPGEAAGSAAAAPPKDRGPTPAERLKLDGKERAKAEKCLANAVYFEARSEPVRGQIAVAQVVMNRVFSGFYPESVCGVVYQNAHRHLSCQFTFACDGIRDVVTEPEHYARAKRIARDTLDGRLWLAEVGKATHYHAMYVRPYWVRSMKKMHRFGLHTFYRPRAWGNGADEPKWGDTAETTKIVGQL